MINMRLLYLLVQPIHASGRVLYQRILIVVALATKLALHIGEHHTNQNRFIAPIAPKLYRNRSFSSQNVSQI